MSLWRLTVLGLGILGTASPITASEPTKLAAVVAAYNDLDQTRTELRVSTEQDDATRNWQAESGYVPSWLDQSKLTDQEIRALIAAIGAFGLDQDQYPKRTSHPAGKVILNMATAMAANVAEEKAAKSGVSNTGSPRPEDKWQEYSHKQYSYKKSPFTLSREDRFAAILVGLNSCAGAFKSALQALERDYPKYSSTEFFRTVFQIMLPYPAKANPTCAAEG